MNEYPLKIDTTRREINRELAMIMGTAPLHLGPVSRRDGQQSGGGGGRGKRRKRRSTGAQGGRRR